MPLTDTAIRQTKPGIKPVKLADGGGLYLLVTSAGARYWRWKYRFSCKEEVLALGMYSEPGWLRHGNGTRRPASCYPIGVDPSQARKDDKRAARLTAESSLEAVACA